MAAREHPGVARLSPAESVQRRLATLRSRARLVLWVERLWPALWPALGLLGAGAVAALFDLPALLLPLVHWFALLALAAGCGWLLWRGLHRLRPPNEAEIDRRLELNGGVAHRPLTVLDDRPALQSPDATALWQAHVRRAADQVARLRSGWPHQGLERVDQLALRGLLVVLLAAGLVVAGPDAPGRLLRAATPGLLLGPAAPEPLLQAWVTPPSYTGLPPLFLRPGDATVSVPAGSHLTVSLTGGTGEPSLSLAGDTQAFHPLDATSWQAERDVGSGGPLVVTRRGRTQGQWTLAIVPDLPPVVAWASPPGAGTAQRKLQTRLPWTAADDYGVVSLQAELRLRDRPAAEPVIVTIPLPANAPKQAKGVQTQDLTGNPWAGLPVVAMLVGKDAPGQHGTSPAVEFTLPERSFKNPLARAVIDIRKRLALAPEDHAQEGADLAALAEAPETFDNNTSVFLLLSTTASLVGRSAAPADVAEAQQRLWTLALQLEDDAVSRTAQALATARDALKQSADPAKPDARQPTDMDRKAEALRQAIQKHLQALAEKARRDGTMMPFDPHARTLNQRDFDKLTREMQQAARAGRTDEARDKMAQLERMLDQLKQAEANPGDRKQAQQQRQKGRQQMGAAEDLVQRETVLKQHAQERPEPDAAAQRKMDTAQQKAMRRALGEMMQQFGDLTGKVPDELSQADLAMRDAAGALAAGQDPAAGTSEQRAIEALQKGEQQMSQQMASSLGISVQPGEGEGQPGDQMSQGDGTGDSAGDSQAEGDGNQDADNGPNGQSGNGDDPRDPLGRPTRDGTSGRADGGNVHVPDQMERARTRDIQAELRRRGADRTRPVGELDYINRLLKAF